MFQSTHDDRLFKELEGFKGTLYEISIMTPCQVLWLKISFHACTQKSNKSHKQSTHRHMYTLFTCLPPMPIMWPTSVLIPLFCQYTEIFRTYFRLYTNQRCICEVQPIRWPNPNNTYQWLYGPDHWSYMKWHPEYNSSISRDYRIAGSFHRHVVSKNGEKWADFENLDFL